MLSLERCDLWMDMHQLANVRMDECEIVLRMQA